MSHINKETLLDYTFDLLEADEKTTVAEHLETCANCRNLLDEISEQFGQLDLIKEDTAEISTALMASVQAMADERLTEPTTHDPSTPRLRRATPTTPGLRRATPTTLPWLIFLVAAACLAVAAIVVFRPDVPTPTTIEVATHTKLEGETPSNRARTVDTPKTLEGETPSNRARTVDTPKTLEGETPSNRARTVKSDDTTLMADAVLDAAPLAERSKAKSMSKKGNVRRREEKAPEALVDVMAGAPSSTRAGKLPKTSPAKLFERRRILGKADGSSLLTLEQPYFEPGSNIELNVLPRRDDVQLTIYNAADLTLVREKRKLTMKRGWNWLQYMWKNTLIDPTSLELKPIGGDGKVEVVQLVFPPRMTGVGRWLIKSEISGQVECEITYFTSGIKWRAFYEGTLTADETQMELKPYVRIDNGSGEEYADAQTRLVVGQVSLREQIITLARRKFAYGAPIAEWTSMIFDDKDVQGDLELSEKDEKYVRRGKPIGFSNNRSFYDLKEAKKVLKQGLSEYMLYTIEGRETIPNKWGKRLRSAEPATVPVKNLYKYDEDRWSRSVMRFVSFKNDKDHKLGESPMPKGQVRVYGTMDGDIAGKMPKTRPAKLPERRLIPGGLTYVGATSTKYVPVGEKVELELGRTEKVLVQPKLMTTETKNFKFDKRGNVDGWDELQEWMITLTNSRRVPVKLEITRNFNSKYWSLIQSNAGVVYKKHDLTHSRFELTLKSLGKLELKYTLTKKHGTNREDGK